MKSMKSVSSHLMTVESVFEPGFLFRPLLLIMQRGAPFESENSRSGMCQFCEFRLFLSVIFVRRESDESSESSYKDEAFKK